MKSKIEMYEKIILKVLNESNIKSIHHNKIVSLVKSTFESPTRVENDIKNLLEVEDLKYED